ncbi:MAG: hypothetical protein JNL97_17070, partial [Verrucomicrobiales bacterium]|nr:hypothetical protein [Verrucomicrobiales bacterium]
DGIALSLAPSQASASGNPVAQNLLGSGSDAGSSPEAEAKTETSEPPPANPAFSIRASYLDTLDVALLGADGKAAPKIWFPVQRGFGPLYVNQLGVGWEPDGDPKRFDLLFDGRVVLAGFRADLMGLSVGIPVDRRITDFSQYRLGLDGFDLSYEGGSVEISAGFLKTESAGVVEYPGLATVKAAGFSLGAVGSYAAIPLPPPHQDRTAPSLFLFGALSAPLGGVPAFFVTGVAAGFSFNRGLRLPSITEVADFPLVTGVVNGSFRSDTPDDSKGVLRQLADDVYPEIGSYWLAAGIKFTSFSLLEGMALLFVRFGRSFELDLLGVASLTLPKGAPKESALAYAELALRVVVDPGQGVVSVEAQLTPNSYVLTRSCKLTGGFAFFVWFRNRTTADGRTIAAGDFVVSLGGYAARFKKPAHYPEVPRLGLTWPIELGFGSLHVAGGAYFALTPSAVMAGGYLDVLFQAGSIRAWFDAVADFYIGWAPFYYSVDVGISLGIAFRLELGGVSVTLRAALGASLHLEGPPTWGSVHVDWYVVSFTIPFGSGSRADTATLDWPAFAAQFLPAPGRADESRETPTPRTRLRTAPGLPVGTRAAAPAPDRAPQQVLKLQVESGLLRTDADTWIVRAEPFVLRVDSAIPISQPALTNPGAPSFRAGPK